MILSDVIDNTIISFGPKSSSKESGSEHNVSSSDNIQSMNETASLGRTIEVFYIYSHDNSELIFLVLLLSIFMASCMWLMVICVLLSEE